MMIYDVLGNGLKSFGTVGTLIFFSGKNYSFMHFTGGILPFKMHKKIFFPLNLILKILGFTIKFR